MILVNTVCRYTCQFPRTTLFYWQRESQHSLSFHFWRGEVVLSFSNASNQYLSAVICNYALNLPRVTRDQGPHLNDNLGLAVTAYPNSQTGPPTCKQLGSAKTTTGQMRPSVDYKIYEPHLLPIA